MTGREGRVLYIGQSSNLRARLSSYKNARPDRAPPKVVRLVQAVETITWEECVSPQAARLRENELLRLHRPRFNRLNTWPGRNCFIGFESRPDGLRFFRTSDPQQLRGEAFGAFKGSAVVAYAALLRLCWTACADCQTPADYPLHLLGCRPPSVFTLPGHLLRRHPEFLPALRQFLTGESDRVVELLRATLPSGNSSCDFLRRLLEADLEILAHFFATGPKRNREFRHHHGLEEEVIPQHELDDMHALAAPPVSGTRPLG